jgi:hypothetical protein
MTEEQILEAITRSGYLFESEISKFLSNSGYFVESNVVFKDPITNKDREIDIITENINSHSFPTNTKVKYFMELKNNSFPIVLLTEFESNPYSGDQTIKEIITTDDASDNYSGFNNNYEKLLNNNRPLFTQYCSFTQKSNKGEIMAFHPDELYSSLNKLCWYCEKEFTGALEIANELKTRTFRHWLYLPVLLINDDLFELTIDESKPKLNKVKYSRLLINFHFDEYLTGTQVYVVTKDYFNDFLQDMNIVESKIAESMLECLNKN